MCRMIGRTCFLMGILLAWMTLSVAAQALATPHTLTVGTKEAPPFSMKGADGKWTGISISLWQDLAAQLKLDYTFQEMDLEHILSGLTNGSVDVGVAAISVTSDREVVMDFTQPFFTTGLGIAISAHSGPPWLSVIRQLVSWQFLAVVGLLVLVLLSVGFLVWLFERRGNAEQFGGKTLEGIGSGFWWSAVTMTTVGYGDKSPRTLGGRIIGLIWMFVAIIIISSFTAAITSALTVSQLGSPIHGPEELPGVRVAGIINSTGAAYLERQHIAYRGYPDALSALNGLAAGEVDAVVYDAPIMQYLAREKHPGTVAILPRKFLRQDYAIAVPQGSPLREQINRLLEGEIRSARWQDLNYRYLGESD